MKSALSWKWYRNKSGLSKSDQRLRFVSNETLSKFFFKGRWMTHVGELEKRLDEQVIERKETNTLCDVLQLFRFIKHLRS